VRPVEFAPGAVRALARLEDFLTEKSQRAAMAAVEAIAAAVESLGNFPERGRLARQGGGRRELVVRFGHVGYVVRYRVTSDRVLVTRIFHGRERR
jgi:plasmid stabilization system protein ParE